MTIALSEFFALYGYANRPLISIVDQSTINFMVLNIIKIGVTALLIYLVWWNLIKLTTRENKV